MKKLLKDKVFVIMLIILILLSFALVSVIIKRKPVKCKKCNCEKEIKEVETKCDTTTKDERKRNYKVITDLLESNEYTNISIDDSRIKYILTAMDNLIYMRDIKDYDDMSRNEIANAIGKLITNDDIYDVDTSGPPEYRYGYIKKSTINNYVSKLFLNEEYLSLPISGGLTISNASSSYYNATVVSKTDDAYYLRFYGREGTFGPHPKFVNSKIISAKEFSDSILIEEKVFYYDYNDEKTIYSDRDKTKVIDKLDIDLDDYENIENTTIDVNNYLDKAGTIYIVLDKKDENFYFKMSQLYYNEESK